MNVLQTVIDVSPCVDDIGVPSWNDLKLDSELQCRDVSNLICRLKSFIKKYNPVVPQEIELKCWHNSCDAKLYECQRIRLIIPKQLWINLDAFSDYILINPIYVTGDMELIN